MASCQEQSMGAEAVFAEAEAFSGEALVVEAGTGIAKGSPDVEAGASTDPDTARDASPADASRNSVLGRYGALFRVRGVPSLVAAMVVARVPTGCVSILLVLCVSMQYGAALAGMAAAAWTIGTAVCAPALGRLVDGGRGPFTLRWTAAVQVVAVAMLLVAVSFGAPAVLVVGSAFLCGACTPPVAGTTRSLWKVLVPEHLLSVAYSFEILLIDVLYVVGPLVASAFVACGVPAWGIAAVTACLVVGSVALSCSSAVKRQAQANRCAAACPAAVRGSSLLRRPGVVVLLLACAGTMAFSGWLETLLPLFYSAQGQSLEGGVAISVWSVGSIVGVLAFVRMQPQRGRMPLVRQLVACTGVYAAVCALLVMGNGWGTGAVCAIMFCIGCAVSPCTNLHYQLGGELAPVSQQAEMFSWLNTATSAGISLGALLAGTAVEQLGYLTSFALPVAFVVASLALAVALQALSNPKR